MLNFICHFFLNAYLVPYIELTNQLATNDQYNSAKYGNKKKQKNKLGINFNNRTDVVKTKSENNPPIEEVKSECSQIVNFLCEFTCASLPVNGLSSNNTNIPCKCLISVFFSVKVSHSYRIYQQKNLFHTFKYFFMLIYYKTVIEENIKTEEIKSEATLAPLKSISTKQHVHKTTPSNPDTVSASNPETTKYNPWCTNPIPLIPTNRPKTAVKKTPAALQGRYFLEN